MNSVFSAFKASKNDGKQKQTSKKLTPDSSYENLKHIRDIGSSSKMTDFVDDSDGICSSGVATQIIRLNSPTDELTDSADVVDHAKTVIVDYIENYHPINNKSSKPTDCADPCKTVQPDRVVETSEQTDTKLYSCQTNDQTNIISNKSSDLSNESNHTSQLPPSGPPIKMQSTTSENQQVPIIVSNNVTDTTNTTNKAKRFQHRLSLKCNPSPTLPSVHGRPTSNNSDTKKKSRLSTHQRNLSLDFRYVLTVGGRN